MKLSKKQISEEKHKIVGWLEEKHVTSKMCDLCHNKCTALIRRKKSSICYKVFNFKQKQFSDRQSRIIYEVFHNVSPEINKINRYIEKRSEQMDKLSVDELNEDFKRFTLS